MILKWFGLWALSFLGISAVDALWHLVIWGRVYGRAIRRVAEVADGKLVLRNGSGLLSQVLVVTAFVVLASLPARTERPLWAAVVACAMGGVLGISVYGLVNRWLLRGWSAAMTVLEGGWGPMIGAFAGAFVFWLRRLLKMA